MFENQNVNYLKINTNPLYAPQLNFSNFPLHSFSYPNQNPINSMILNSWINNQNKFKIINTINNQNGFLNVFSPGSESDDSSENSEDKKAKKSTESTDYKTKWKTEKCHYWELDGECKFGENCAFAHGDKELKQKINYNISYKTNPCKQFFEEGYCNYGIRCQFSHKKSVYERYHNIKPKAKFKNIIYTKIINGLVSKGQVDKNVVERPRLDIFEKLAPSSKDDIVQNRLLFYQDIIDFNFFLNNINFHENANP